MRISVHDVLENNGHTFLEGNIIWGEISNTVYYLYLILEKNKLIKLQIRTRAVWPEKHGLFHFSTSYFYYHNAVFLSLNKGFWKEQDTLLYTWKDED